jgi:hypothetical protein
MYPDEHGPFTMSWLLSGAQRTCCMVHYEASMSPVRFGYGLGPIVSLRTADIGASDDPAARPRVGRKGAIMPRKPAVALPGLLVLVLALMPAAFRTSSSRREQRGYSG